MWAPSAAVAEMPEQKRWFWGVLQNAKFAVVEPRKLKGSAGDKRQISLSELPFQALCRQIIMSPVVHLVPETVVLEKKSILFK